MQRLERSPEGYILKAMKQGAQMLLLLFFIVVSPGCANLRQTVMPWKAPMQADPPRVVATESHEVEAAIAFWIVELGLIASACLRCR